MNKKLLLIGCGNSSLGFDLWQDGFTNIECMDYAESVIERMNLKYKNLMCPDENQETEEYKILKN